MNWTISVGLNDRYTHKQNATHMQAVAMLASLFTCGATFVPTIGVYKGEIENSLKIEAYGYTMGDIMGKAIKIKEMLNQEAVIVTNMITQESTWVDDEYVKQGA